MAALCAAPAPASAATTETAYGHWDMSGQSGTLTVPVTGFPTAQVTTTSSSVQVPGGTSSYLNTSTPFGAKYGNSRGEQYLVLRTSAGLNPSSSVLTFNTPTKPGSWSFALGDVDADLVRVSATGPSGNPVSNADLGFQGTFNYCVGSPLPTACLGTPSTDVPTWDPAAATLTGTGTDTNGASGWLTPRVPIKSLTLQFEKQTGVPVYQLWVAAQGTSTEIVKPPPAPPVTVGEDTPVEIVIPPATDPARTPEIVDPPTHGTVKHLKNGNLLYTPEQGFTGTDTFKYLVHLKDGKLLVETVVLRVVSTLADTGASLSPWLFALAGALLALGAATIVATRAANPSGPSRRRGARRL